MFEKLSPRMDAVIKLAQRIAREYDQDYVGTEHLLLAILREGTGLAVSILADLGADLPKVKATVDRLIKGTLEDTWVFGRLPGTPHFRNVMASAIEEARAFKNKQVCTEHLLIALAKERGSVAHSALAELGVKPEAVREEVRKRGGAGEAGPTAAAGG